MLTIFLKMMSGGEKFSYFYLVLIFTFCDAAILHDNLVK